MMALYLDESKKGMEWDEKHGLIKEILNELNEELRRNLYALFHQILSEKIQNFNSTFEHNQIKQNDAVRETQYFFDIIKRTSGYQIIALRTILDTWTTADRMYPEEHENQRRADFNLNEWPSISHMGGEFHTFLWYIHRRRTTHLRVQVILISSWQETSKREMKELKWSKYKCEGDDTCTEGIPVDVDRFFRTIGVGFTKNELATLFDKLRIGKKTSGF